MAEHSAEIDAIHEVRRAMRALYAVVSAAVARDVASRVEAALAQAWDFGYACGLGDYGKGDDETQAANPYRVLPPATTDTQKED